MHPRTLNRRLRAERTTFRKLLNQARFDVARQLLAGTHMDVSGISGALGYAETSAFTHAFRHMAAASPAEWRAGLTEGALAPTAARAPAWSDCPAAPRGGRPRRTRVCWRRRRACRIVKPVPNIPRRTPCPADAQS